MIPAPQLYQQHLKRQQSRVATYNKVLQRIEKRIIHASSMDQFQIQYDIPDMMMGEPLYKSEACLLYLYMKMTRLGYEVSIQLPRSIVVSWNRYDTEEEDEISPIFPPPKQVTFLSDPLVTKEKAKGQLDQEPERRQNSRPIRSCLAKQELAKQGSTTRLESVPVGRAGNTSTGASGSDLLTMMQNQRNVEIQSWSTQIPSSIWGRR